MEHSTREAAGTGREMWGTECAKAVSGEESWQTPGAEEANGAWMGPGRERTQQPAQVLRQEGLKAVVPNAESQLKVEKCSKTLVLMGGCKRET